MEVVSLIMCLNGIFSRELFKKKARKWSKPENGFVKIIELQKSSFSNAYYLNFGFKIFAITSGDTFDIFNRLHGDDILETRKISILLDLDCSISDFERLNKLKQYIEIHLIAYFENVNNEDDIRAILVKMDSHNTIPLEVLSYFNMI